MVVVRVLSTTFGIAIHTRVRYLTLVRAYVRTRMLCHNFQLSECNENHVCFHGSQLREGANAAGQHTYTLASTALTPLPQRTPVLGAWYGTTAAGGTRVLY